MVTAVYRAMRLEKLTEKSRESLQEAQDRARGSGNPEVVPEHLLMALLAEPEGIARALLEKLGAPLPELSRQLEESLAKEPRVEGDHDLRISADLGRSLERAAREASGLGDDYVSTEHLLLGL